MIATAVTIVGIGHRRFVFGLLLHLIGQPALIDEVGVNFVGIGLAQKIIEAFHAPWRQGAFEEDIFKEVMYLERQLPQIGCHTRSEDVAPRTLFDELDFAVADLRLGRFGLRRLRKDLVTARGGLRHFARTPRVRACPIDAGRTTPR